AHGLSFLPRRARRITEEGNIAVLRVPPCPPWFKHKGSSAPRLRVTRFPRGAEAVVLRSQCVRVDSSSARLALGEAQQHAAQEARVTESDTRRHDVKILPAGTPAPEFALHATPDQVLHLSELRGRPVI